MLLHHEQGFGGEFPRADSLARMRHDLAHRRAVQIEPSIECSAQIAVGVDANGALCVIDHHGHTHTDAGHLDEALREREVGGDFRDAVTGAHDIFDAGEQPSTE